MRYIYGVMLVSSLIVAGVLKEFAIDGKTKARVEFDANGVSVVINGKKEILQKMDKKSINRLLQMGEGALLELKDFNFDGYKDIALSSANIGYGGVNNYKNYYFYNPSTRHYYLAGKNINSLQIRGKELISYTKDGPFTYEEHYSIADGKLYKSKQSLELPLVKKVALFNKRGKKILESFQPSMLTVRAAKAYFYQSPDNSSKTKVYIIKGDKVKVLDYKPFDGWVKIEYKSPKKVFTAWVKEDVLQ